MKAVPSPTAITLPSLSTLTTVSSLEVKVTLPASAGVKVPTITASSSTCKSKEAGSTLISVGTLLTVTVTVTEFSA